jgi:2-polyprenyl-3-methyl-5-hydroxy-6-metoxy-1,4-benzoquinol methylase
MTFNKYKTRGAYHYDWYKNNTFNYRDCVDKCIEFCEGSTLDVGCGEGLIVDKLTELGYKAEGIDNDRTGIELGRIGGHEIWLHDINKPLKGKWEYMVCLNVIEHLEYPERIKEIFNHNITKAAIIITDIPQGDLPPEHVHEFTPYELKQMFHTRKVKAFSIGKDFHGIEIYKT